MGRGVCQSLGGQAPKGQASVGLIDPMIKARAIEVQDPHARPTVTCPGCRGVMSEGSKLCVQCEARARGRRLEERWTKQHRPGMIRRHRRVVEIMADTGLGALDALQKAQLEWGEQ